MALLSVTNLAHSHGTQQVLGGVTFSIEPGECVGLVGRNGTGKTTLLRAISGGLKADTGQIQLTRGMRIGYLRQDPEFKAGDTVFDAAEGAFADLHQAHAAMHDVAAQMAEATGKDLDRLMKKYARLEHDVERLGGYSVEHRIEETLHGLGFSDEQFTRPVEVLSGGQKGRLALAQLLLEQPDLLLLDEPTNHLDIDGRKWLEGFLKNEYPGAVILVSHDRYLLDRVVSRILEIETAGRVFTYPGNYVQFCEQRLQRKLIEKRVYEKQQDYMRSEKKFIDRYKAGQRAKQAAGRESRLDRFRQEMAERPIEMDVMRLNLPKAARCGDMVATAEHVAKGYDGRTLFDDFSIKIMRGDRIGIIGPNGIGKSTLIKILVGDLKPDAGTTRPGAGVSIGYYQQSHDHLNFDLTIWQYLQSVILSLDGAVKASEQQARDLAGAFLFSGDVQDKTLAQVSGGERSRAVLAGIVSGGHNLLVLDEPTNHFDIPSSERLERALDPETGFNGTLILISHDRALLDACVTQLIIFDGKGGVASFLGNYSEWVEHVKQKAREKEHAAAEVVRQATRKKKKEKKKEPQGSSKSTGSKAGGRDVGRSKSTKKKKARPGTGTFSILNVTELEKRIEKIELRIRAIDESLMDPKTHRNPGKSKKLGDERVQLMEELEPLEFEWSRRAEAD